MLFQNPDKPTREDLRYMNLRQEGEPNRPAEEDDGDDLGGDGTENSPLRATIIIDEILSSQEYRLFSSPT
jgi:hypothetical protein